MPAANGGGRWSQLGFDLRNNQHNPHETTLRADNVAGLRELWRLHIPGGASSTPVIAEGTAYFGGWNGHFYAVDASSGAIRWERRLTTLLIRSTALIANDLIYVAAGVNLVALRRSDGATLFETPLDSHLETLLDASPKLIDDLVIIGVSHYENSSLKDDYTSIGAIVAIDAISGQQVWRIPTTGAGPGPCTGGAGVSVWSSIAVDPELGLAYVGTGQTFEAPASTCADSLLAFHYARAFEGERIAWKVQFTADDIYAAGLSSLGPDADVGASPNLFEARGQKLVGVGDKGGSYRVFERVTGEQVWRKDLALGIHTGAGGVMVTAAVSDETVYVASNRFVNGSFVFSGVHDPADTGLLYAFDIATGSERWTQPLPAPMVGSIAIANGVLYHPIINGTLYARSLASGEVLWSSLLDASIGAGPSVVDGRVFVSGGMVFSGAQAERSGVVSAFGLGTGPLLEREAAPDVLETLTPEQCAAELRPELIESPSCAECLCACNATAAGHCDVCWRVAPCTAAFCWLAQPGEEMRQCIAAWCGPKLLPTYLMDRAVEVGPCVVECAARCGF